MMLLIGVPAVNIILSCWVSWAYCLTFAARPSDLKYIARGSIRCDINNPTVSYRKTKTTNPGRKDVTLIGNLSNDMVLKKWIKAMCDLINDTSDSDLLFGEDASVILCDRYVATVNEALQTIKDHLGILYDQYIEDGADSMGLAPDKALVDAHSFRAGRTVEWLNSGIDTNELVKCGLWASSVSPEEHYNVPWLLEPPNAEFTSEIEEETNTLLESIMDGCRYEVPASSVGSSSSESHSETQ
ncbi:hypothetical protein PCE1_003955 [Barthelona sp. PCE]